MRYAVDTSALVDAWTRWYSPEVMPSFWDKMAELGEASELTIPDAVLWELESRDDDLYGWCKKRAEFLVTPFSDEIQEPYRKLANGYPNLRVTGPSNKNYADLHVVAVAKHFGCAVVTHEQATGNLNGPRIPDVCRNEGLEVLQLDQLVRRENWRFA